MLGSAGKKLTGGDKSEGKGPDEQLTNLAAGVVNQTGEVVDGAGNTVGKITEGVAGDLVGNVVTATGDIVGKDGGIVGKALALGEDGEEAKDGEGFNLMGATKGVKGVIDLTDGTLQTVSSSVPLVGDLTKGLGLGGGEGKGESSSLLGGLLGSKPEDRDPDEREKVTEQAKKDLFDTSDKASEAAPIDLKDQEKAADDARLELTDDTTDNLTEVSPDDAKIDDTTEKAKGTAEDTTKKAGEAAEGAKDTAEGAADDTKDKVDDTTEGAKDTAEDAKDKADETADDAKAKAEDATEGAKDTAEDAKDKADETTDDAKAKADDTTGDAKDTAEDTTSKAGDAVEGAKGAVDETKDTAEGAADETASKAEGAADEAKDTADETASKAEGAADETASKAEGAADEAKDTADETASKAEGAADETASKAEDAADETASKAEDAAKDAKSHAGDTATINLSALDDVETVRMEGDKLVAPFEKFADGAKIDDEGKVLFEDGTIGEVVEGNPEDLAGKKITPEGLVIGDNGTELGRVELKDEVEEELKKKAAENLALLKGCKVNKGGNLVNDKNEVIGRIVSGILKNMIGRKADDKGQIWNDGGEVIGQAELVPEKDRQEFKEPAPFEDFPEATVQSNGEVTSDGEIVGRLVEGDAKKLKGKKVDEDGDILDKQGNKLGHAERWEPEPEAEPEPEPEVDNSALAGKRVNKAGNVVDSNGQIFGRVIEGDPKRLNGRMCNKNGEILSESGDVIGKAELVPEGEREGLKEGPFSDLPGCTVAKDGTVVTPSGDIVGRLTKGDGKVLFGRAVDEDGEVLDKNGNSLGQAERWEPPEEEKKPDGPLKGLRVNKKGEVYDKEGNLLAKLVSGDLAICSGKEIDDDNDVIDSKGNVIGHVSLVEDIPEPEPEEPEETAEEKAKREAEEKEKAEAEKDEKLARDLGGLVEQGLDKIRPICSMISDKIDAAERKPKDELDEEALVKEVKPLIEEGGKILDELNGTIRALDPDGRIQRNAKHKSGTREGTSAEHHLAEVLKELTGTVSKTIDSAKKKIADMPHAKKELNPLWGLLTEPLGQILAAVGLLLAGVLNLVGRLLGGLGLGGIVDGLLGTLGLNRVLDGLGLSSVTSALTGKNNKKK